VSDSRADIGLFRALGATRRDVRRLFLSETVLLGWLGTLIGILCGWALAWYISHWVLNKVTLEMSDPEELLKIPDTLFAFDFRFAALLFIGAGILAWLAGYWPARRASHIDPVKALRRE
jgi:ABC-type antimicrobial peptide transport system permease subunit